MRRHALALGFLVSAACGGGDDFHYTGAPGSVVPMTFGGLLPTATVTINSGPQHAFVCDTGSPVTILDSPSFPGLADGKHNDDIAAFQLVFDQYQDASWNFGTSGTEGLLGGDLLRHFAFTIDYKGQRGMLSDPLADTQLPTDNPTESPIRVPFNLTGGGAALLPGNCAGKPNCGTIDLPPTRILLQATFENHAPVWIVVDTGATAILLDETYLNSTLADLTRRPRLDGIKVAGVNGVMDAYYTRVWRLTLDGVNSGDPTISADNVPAFVVTGSMLLTAVGNEVHQPIVALVGGTYFRNFLTTIDYPNRQLRLARYSSESHIPADEFVGPGFSLDVQNGQWFVTEIYPSSDAYAQGIRSGDLIDTIGNMPIMNQPASVVRGIEKMYTANQTMPVGVRRGGSVSTLNVLVKDFLPPYPPPP